MAKTKANDDPGPYAHQDNLVKEEAAASNRTPTEQKKADEHLDSHPDVAKEGVAQRGPESAGSRAMGPAVEKK